MTTLELLQDQALLLLSDLESGLIGDTDDDGEMSLDIRVRYFDGDYSLLSGDISYDTDHRGEWAYSCLTPEMSEEDVFNVISEMFDEVNDSDLN